MSGERKNTITKSATANTTMKKVLSQGQADILIAIVAMTWGCSYLLMKIGLTGNAAILHYRTAFLHCIYYRCTGFLAENEADEPAHSWIRKYSRAASVWCVCFSCSGNEIHDRFQCWIHGWYCVCIRTGSTQFLKHKLPSKRTQLLESFWLYLESVCLHSLHLYN